MKINLFRIRRSTSGGVRRRPPTRAARSAWRKAVAECAGGVLLVAGFVAIGLLHSPTLAAALGCLSAGAILVLVGNV